MIDNKEIGKISLNLVIIYLLVGTILVSVYAYTHPIIEKNEVQKKNSVLKSMIPGGENIIKLGDWHISEENAEYFKVTKNDGTLCGYIIETYGRGYSSNIHSMLGVDPNLKVLNITILSQAETPGLGDEVESKEFRGQFIGKSIENMEVVKTSGTDKIQALTGATISSRAVTNSERAALEQLSKIINKGQAN
jgi:electron transport complex protein RnfG